MLKLVVLAFLTAYTYAAYYEDIHVPYWVNKINSEKGNWRAGYNKFLAGKSLEDMKRLMGTKMDIHTRPAAPIKTHNVDFATLPTTFTSGKDKWTACAGTINYIKDQADCGSCWAIAASEVVEDRICIANMGGMKMSKLNEPAPQIAMSGNDILTCCSWCGDGCQGGYPIDAMKYWSWNGVVTGGWYGSNCGCQPYTVPPCGPNGCSGPEQATPACSQSCIPSYSMTYQQDKHMATSYYQIAANAAMIQQEVYMNGPVECAFDVYENFMSYTSGVYDQISGQYLGGHAVKVIGWGVMNNENYWLINNSWNVTWGMNGQFMFLRGTNLANMESQCVAGLAKKADTNYQLKC